MSNDDTPTPRQSGSYAVMQGICEDTLCSLAEWRMRSAKDPDVWRRVWEFDQRFLKLLAAVRSWEQSPPAPAVKACTIEDILAARTEAADWGARWGWAL